MTDEFSLTKHWYGTVSICTNIFKIESTFGLTKEMNLTHLKHFLLSLGIFFIHTHFN